MSTMLMGVLLFLLLLLLLLLLLFFFFKYWDLELMPLSAKKRRRRPNFNRAHSSARLLILNGLTM